MILHEVFVYNKTRTPISHKLVSDVILKSLKNLGIKQPVEMAVLIVGDKEIRRLNKVWRRKDRATNVLSFPHMTKTELKRFKRSNVLSSNFGSGSRKLANPVTYRNKLRGKFDSQPKFMIPLGQILISPRQISPEARKDRKNFDRELIELIIHGLLHLLGYDHKSTKETERMEKIEERLFERIFKNF